MTTTLSVLSPEDVRNAYLRYVRCELIARGVLNPNVTDKSDYAVRAYALAQVISPCSANAVAAAEINMPDTAVGDRLQRWLDVYGIVFRAAQGSSGSVIYKTAASSYVAIETRLVDDRGQFYEVTMGGTYSDGDSIPIRAVSVGAATNRIAGTVMQWVTPPTYASPRVSVATGGLSDGSDADTEDVARQRLKKRMRYSEGGGNWAQTIAWAENVIAGTTAFDYPALNGPSTYGLWVLSALRWSGTRFSRQLSDSARASVASYVRSQKPVEAYLTMPTLGDDVSIRDQPVDVSIDISLPAAVSAGGPGGGWTDAAPWPLLSSTATRVTVSTVTDSTHITVTSDAPGACPDPAGIYAATTKVSWFDPSGYPGTVIKTSVVASRSGTTGSVSLVLASPFAGIQVGDYIFPSCERAEEYAQAWLAAVGSMGPGEWTTDATVLADARRQPLATKEAPHTIGLSQRKALEQVGDEVLDVRYHYASSNITYTPANTKTSAPYVLVPGRRLGFYPPK